MLRIPHPSQLQPATLPRYGGGFSQFLFAENWQSTDCFMLHRPLRMHPQGIQTLGRPAAIHFRRRLPINEQTPGYVIANQSADWWAVEGSACGTIRFPLP